MDIRLYTLFDHGRSPPRPWCSLILRGKKAKFYPLFAPKTNLTLHEILQTKQELKEIIQSEVVLLNDVKAHALAFELKSQEHLNLFEANVEPLIPSSGTISDYKKQCAAGLKDLLSRKTDDWRAVLARAQMVYRDLEERGIVYQNNFKYPKYGLTYTGRSKTSGFNIQGATDPETYHTNPHYDWMIHFDWIAADLRVASIMSQDSKLLKSYEESDPYSYMANVLNKVGGKGLITRNDCKSSIFKCLYSLNLHGSAMAFYPEFKEWAVEVIKDIHKHGFSSSIMDRKFHLDKDRTDRTLFNAIFQGSVAHAMQLALTKIAHIYPDNIMAETHDAVVLAGEKHVIPDIVKNVSKIMLNPFEGELPDNPVFPVRVSIGNRWRKWKHYKVFR